MVKLWWTCCKNRVESKQILWNVTAVLECVNPCCRGNLPTRMPEVSCRLLGEELPQTTHHPPKQEQNSLSQINYLHIIVNILLIKIWCCNNLLCAIVQWRAGKARPHLQVERAHVPGLRWPRSLKVCLSPRYRAETGSTLWKAQFCVSVFVLLLNPLAWAVVWSSQWHFLCCAPFSNCYHRCFLPVSKKWKNALLHCSLLKIH